MIEKKCVTCGKKFIVHNHRKESAKCCSMKCRDKYFKKYKIGAWYNPKIKEENTKKGLETCKKYRKAFYDPKVQSMGGKIGGPIAAKVNRKNKTCACFDPKFRGVGGRIAQKKHPNLYKEMGKKFGSINGKKSAEINKRNRNLFWDSEFQREMSKRGIKKHRENKPYIFKGVFFDSNGEREIAMNIYYQFGIKFVERVNCHLLIGRIEVDFFVKKCFIEYHPWDRRRTPKEYHQERRNVLNKNGYKNYPLIVIK